MLLIKKFFNNIIKKLIKKFMWSNESCNQILLKQSKPKNTSYIQD